MGRTTAEDTVPAWARRLQWRTRINTIMATLALVGGGAVTAYAAIPSSGDNTVTACVTGIGTVRIVDTDAGQKCLLTEKQVQWGGGMRSRGDWSVSNGSTYRQGDVVHAGTSLGCGSGRTGSYVRTAYAPGSDVGVAPCLSRNASLYWLPLALDGTEGKDGNRDVHWVNVSATGTIVASSETPADFLSDSTAENSYVKFVGVDPSKCALSTVVSDLSGGTAGADNVPVVGSAYVYQSGYVYATVRRADNGHAASHMPYTVFVDCTRH